MSKDGKVLIACSYDGKVAAINFSAMDLGHSLSFVEKDKLFQVGTIDSPCRPYIRSCLAGYQGQTFGIAGIIVSD
jgi:hypothetical protein